MSNSTSDTPLLPKKDEIPELIPPPEHEFLVEPPEEILLPERVPEEVPSPETQTPTVPSVGEAQPFIAPDIPSALPQEQVSPEDDATLFDTLGTEAELNPEEPVSFESQSEELPISTSEPVIESEVSNPPETPIPSNPENEASGGITPPPLPADPIIHQESAPIPHKNRKMLWIFLGGIGVLLVGGAVWAFLVLGQTNFPGENYSLVPVSDESSYSGSIQTEQENNENDISFFNQAMAEKNARYCERISSEEKKLECTESIQALTLSQSGTIEQCQTLTLIDIRDRCVSSVAQNEALTTNNKSLCDKISDTNKVQSCREAVDAPILAQMIANKTATIEVCQTFEPVNQAVCTSSITEQDDTTILAQAVAADNLEICQKLSTDDLQYACFDTILMKRALTNNDKTLCDYIHDEKQKVLCIEKTTTRDDNTSFRDAVTNKNINLCANIQGAVLRDRCHDAVTLLLVRDTRDGSLCDTLVATGSIDACKASVLQ